MAALGTLPALPSRFDRFLLATIGMERNGMDLSVLSMLARLGKDPWAEAARLARLPRAAAADSLAAVIARLPAGGRQQAHAQMVALCLVALLPDQPGPAADATAANRGQGGDMAAKVLMGATLSSALALGLLVCGLVLTVAGAGAG